jgi:hypothetical protein
MTRHDENQRLGREWMRADDALWALDPDADKRVIAEAVAERTVAGNRPPYYLHIFHDVRPKTLGGIEAMKKIIPTYKHDEPYGPCPVRYDYTYKNTVGIKERDREVAKRWITEAFLLGYSVFSAFKKRSGIGAAAGDLAMVRERIRERKARIKEPTQ